MRFFGFGKKKDIYPEKERVKHITAPQAKIATEQHLKKLFQRDIDSIMSAIDSSVKEGQNYTTIPTYRITDAIEKHFENIGYRWEESDVSHSRAASSYGGILSPTTATYAIPYKKLKWE